MKFWHFVAVIAALFGAMYCADVAIAEIAMVVKDIEEAQIDKHLLKALIANVMGNLDVSAHIATYLMIMAGLRAIAEVGGIIANKTSAKWDNKLVQSLSNVLNTVSWAAGLLGVGTPKNTTKPKRESK